MTAHIPVLKPILDGSPDGETLFFVQGWPDDHTLWDDLVDALRDRYRCVRVDLPNYGTAEHRRWGFDHDAIVEALANAIREVSPKGPVTVIAHDWGAFWSYMLHHRHPELVARLVGLDIAPELQPTLREAAFIVSYQWWLLGAFVLGGAPGNWMTRRFARMMHSPRQGAAIDASVNYPYLYTWRDLFTGRAQKALKGYFPKIPILFIYGEKKPGRFHSDRWLERVRSGPANRVVALPNSGHWVTKDPALNGIVREWLVGST